MLISISTGQVHCNDFLGECLVFRCVINSCDIATTIIIIVSLSLSHSLYQFSFKVTLNGSINWNQFNYWAYLWMSIIFMGMGLLNYLNVDITMYTRSTILTIPSSIDRSLGNKDWIVDCTLILICSMILAFNRL